jgi:hypothetical protein
VKAIANVIGGHVGRGAGVAASAGRLMAAGVAALAALNCNRAPATPPSVIPAIVTETLVIFIVDRTTHHHHQPVRTQAIWLPA